MLKGQWPQQWFSPTYESETIEAFELGLKTDLLDGKARANIALFTYDYSNLQFQATDPDPYRGGVANIPESEMSGLEVELQALFSDNLSMDLNLAFSRLRGNFRLRSS